MSLLKKRFHTFFSRDIKKRKSRRGKGGRSRKLEASCDWGGTWVELKCIIYRICIIVIIGWPGLISLSVFHFLLLSRLVFLPRFLLSALYLLLFPASSKCLMWRAGVMLDETVSCCFLSEGYAVDGLSGRSFLSMCGGEHGYTIVIRMLGMFKV